MKKSMTLLTLCSAAMLLAGCKGESTQKTESQSDTIKTEVADSTVYGKCGEGTMMNTLELITDDGNTISFTIDEENGTDVQGGKLTGDRMAVTYYKSGEENIAHKVINITTLLGQWTSLDKDFTINEDGSIESNLQTETKPFTAWSICNAKLVINTDTFDVVTLGADSLELENSNGIFVYKRHK